MTSPIASTSSSKVPKNPGLALNLKTDVSGALSPDYSVTRNRQLPSAIRSLSNTPELEPDWINEDASDDGEDEDTQYVYIASDSPFYRPPSTPRTSSYLSVSGFPFACDALAEEDPLFAHSPGIFDNESDAAGDIVVIVDADFTGDLDSRSNVEWQFTESLDQRKPTRADIASELF